MAQNDQGLLRPDLWELLLPAIKAAQQAGREFAVGNAYVPRQPLVAYQQNDAGWPQVTKDTPGFGTRSDLIDWSELFDVTENRFTRILVAKVSPLAEAMQEISRSAMEDPELLRGVSILAPLMTDDDEAKVRGQAESEIARHLVGAILNRADALDAETDDELRLIYQQLERARFAKELSGDIVVPLVAVAFVSHDPVQIDGSVWIERLTEADHRVRALNWLQQDELSPWVAAGATHAVVVRGVTFPNTLRDLNEHIPFALFEDEVRNTIEAVHIVTEKATGYAQVLVRPDGWAASWMQDLPPLWQAWRGRAYPDVLSGRQWANEMTPIDAAQTADIARIAKSLKAAPKNVQMAARRLRRTTFRDSAEDQVLDVAIGIEALVGKEVDALTHRMAQRAAIALARRIPAGATYNLLKQFYNIRSAIAHGSEPKSWTVKLGDDKLNGVQIGMFLLRELLQNRLLGDDPWDAGSLDERMLKSFGQPADDDEGDEQEA